MVKKIMNFLKRIFPPSAKTFNGEIERIASAIEELNKQESDLREMVLSLNIHQSELHEELYVNQLEVYHNLLDSIQKSDNNSQLTYMNLFERYKTLQLEIQNELVGGLKKQENEILQLKAKISELDRSFLAQQVLIEGLQQQLLHVDERYGAYCGSMMTLLEEQKQAGLDFISTTNDSAQKASEERKTLLAEIERTRKIAWNSKKHAAEAVWAQVFNNSILNSEWLTNQTFSPGRWAAGYPALYVMYRVLNEFRPKCVLELGLGQSTRMIAQYASANDDVKHYVVEHDAQWIKFFENSFEISDKTQIVQLETEIVPYKDCDAVRTYRDFESTFEGKIFDFIFIDAPYGGDLKGYSRIDVLKMLPNCLAEDFVVLLDDTHRISELQTAKEIEATLKENKIEFASASYDGEKSCALFCNKNNCFLTTM